MDCSVIVCTRNQHVKLARMLESMAAMTVAPDVVWELIVVDNGSEDATPATVDGFAGRLPVRRIAEPQPGLSNARNAGIDEARGRYIVWTDDDVLVIPGWLDAFCAAFAAHTDAALFAGRITPVLEPPTPDWFRAAVSDLHYLLATRDFGAYPVPLSVADDRLPFGASFAVRTAEQRAFRYDPDLGVAPGRRRGGEETAVAIAILAAGNAGWWVPGAEVKHLIASDRQTTAYIEHYYAAMGEAWARGTGTVGIPGLTRVKVAARSIHYAAARVTRHPKWVHTLASLSFHRGALAWFRAHASRTGR